MRYAVPVSVLPYHHRRLPRGNGLSALARARSRHASAGPAANPPLNYNAEGMYHWDTWFLPLGDSVHMYHLQVKRPGSQRPGADHEAVGHAVSKDLIHWQEQPVALRKGPPGSYDDGCLFTAYAVEHDGTIYLYYCSNHNENGRGRQGICLATSKDGGRTYEKYADNPIIEPDPNRYYAISEPPAPFAHHAHPHIDCRDLAIVKDPAGNGWLGYVVMRRKVQQDAFHSACIALCRSKDLVRWEIGDPVCTPNRFNCFEVPDVFKLGDKWYMIALTGDAYGQSQRWSDPEITCATVVFEADRPEGPFEEVKGNLLLASKKNVWQGFSARTVLCKDERLMFYTRCEGTNGRGSLSWPVRLAPRKEGGLNPMYWPGNDTVFGPAVALSPEGVPMSDVVFMVTATVELKDAIAAGIAFGNYQVLLDSRGKVSLVDEATGKTVQDRLWPIRPSGAYKLRLVVVESMVDVYVDDLLVMDYYLAGRVAGRVSPASREGAGRFVDASYSALNAGRANGQ